MGMEEGSELSLGLKAPIISHSRRRFSASHIRTSFREDACGYGIRPKPTFSSTSSSPAYSKAEIDPSTYSFSSALKALQAKSSYNCSSPNGFALNPKWSDAEKYISNPLSGEVPVECLSAKTLSGRSFRHYTDMVTMSAPLVSSSTSRRFHSKPASATPSTSSSTVTQDTDEPTMLSLQGKKTEGRTTRDVGIQNIMPQPSLTSPSTALTPQIVQRSNKQCESYDSPDSTTKLQDMGEDELRATKREDGKKDEGRKMGRRQGGTGCLLWMGKRMREKHKSRKKNIHNVADVM